MIVPFTFDVSYVYFTTLQIPAAELLECVQVSLKYYSGPSGEFKVSIY